MRLTCLSLACPWGAWAVADRKRTVSLSLPLENILWGEGWALFLTALAPPLASELKYTSPAYSCSRLLPLPSPLFLIPSFLCSVFDSVHPPSF